MPQATSSGAVSAPSFSHKSISGHTGDSAPVISIPTPCATWRAVITFFTKDVVIERVLTNRQAPMTGSTRGPVSRFSRKSKTRFLLTARAVPGLQTFTTLTYAADHPTDADTIRAHWERLRKWLTRRGRAGVWKREFQARGAVHLHLLLDGDVDAGALRQFWAKLSGNGSPRAVDVRPIDDIDGLLRYLAKDAGGARDADDAGFRFWGVFGGAQPVVTEQVVGTLHELAPLLRVARKLDARLRRAAELPARRDDGQRGRVLWNAAEVLRKHLPRLLALYGFENAGARPEKVGRALLTDKEDLKQCPGCDRRKPREDFHRDGAQSDGLHQYCKPCKSERSAARYSRYPFDTLARNFNGKAARLGVEGRVTGLELETIFNAAAGCCIRCGSPEKPHFDHVVSFAERGSNIAANIQLLCQRCSLWKGRRCMDFRAQSAKKI